MKQALVLVDEINRKKRAMRKTKSEYLILDYAKSISSDIRELKIYCKYKRLSFKDLQRKML